MNNEFICKKCGLNHHTDEHRIFEKLKAIEDGKTVGFIAVDRDNVHIEVLEKEQLG